MRRGVGGRPATCDLRTSSRKAVTPDFREQRGARDTQQPGSPAPVATRLLENAFYVPSLDGIERFRLGRSGGIDRPPKGLEVDPREAQPEHKVLGVSRGQHLTGQAAIVRRDDVVPQTAESFGYLSPRMWIGSGDDHMLRFHPPS